MQNKIPKTDSEIMKKYLEIYNFLGEVIWWCQPANNPIYNIKDGKRIPKDLYEIRDGFKKAYNNFYDAGVRINAE